MTFHKGKDLSLLKSTT